MYPYIDSYNSLLTTYSVLVRIRNGATKQAAMHVACLTQDIDTYMLILVHVIDP